jgi:cell division protein FtsB
MFNIFNKKIFKYILVVGLIGLIVFGIYYFVFKKVNQKKRILEMQLNMLSKEIEYLEKENQNLKEGIFNSSKEEYYEREARLNLGYKKEGETAVILSSTTTTKKENLEEVNIDIWSKIKNWFKGL